MKNWIVNEELYAQAARKAQAEGIVMLENRDSALPLLPGSRIALFGRTQFHYYKSGTGSGGMVIIPSSRETGSPSPGSRRRWRSRMNLPRAQRRKRKRRS